jgi:hypothetical protein
MVFQQAIDYPIIQVYFKKLMDDSLNATMNTLENIVGAIFSPNYMTVY